MVIAMDIQPYSGGPSTQTLFSIRDSSTNAVSFVAELSDSTGKITFFRKDSSGVLTAVATPSLSLIKSILLSSLYQANTLHFHEKDTWNRLIIEYTQAQPLSLIGSYYFLRVVLGSSSSSQLYFADSSGTSSTPALFFGVSSKVLDFCSQVVSGTTPTIRQTTKDGNFDILNFLWLSGPRRVYQNTACKITCHSQSDTESFNI